MYFNMKNTLKNYRNRTLKQALKIMASPGLNYRENENILMKSASMAALVAACFTGHGSPLTHDTGHISTAYL